MGFFSGVRRRIKKLIPKEIRPFVPYIAAGMIGPGGLGALGQTSSRFLTAAAARAATDDEANLKDIARAGGLAALPSALSDYGAGEGIGAQYAKTAGDYIAKQGALKTGAAQGAIDMGIKAAELNEDALEEYNRMLAEQGIADKGFLYNIKDNEFNSSIGLGSEAIMSEVSSSTIVSSIGSNIPGTSGP